MAGSFKRLEPLLDQVKSSPMMKLKNNISLLVTDVWCGRSESAHHGFGKNAEAERLKSLDESDQEGYVLTRISYEA